MSLTIGEVSRDSCWMQICLLRNKPKECICGYHVDVDIKSVEPTEEDKKEFEKLWELKNEGDGVYMECMDCRTFRTIVIIDRYRDNVNMIIRCSECTKLLYAGPVDPLGFNETL